MPFQSCWIANHVDREPGPDTRDYACGHLTYDAHNGTDFAVRDLLAMTSGTRVLAAAPGVVAAIRDGEPDVSVRERGLEKVKGKECGNGVRIDHGGGWQTQYCHLRRGSIAVRPGDKVAAGSAIGQVGLSGETEFPHLHFTVRQGDRIVDPFLVDAERGNCGTDGKQLWDSATAAALRYSPGALYNYGVAATQPSLDDVRSGRLRGNTLPASAPMLAAWAEFFGVEPGNEVEIQVTSPDGKTLVQYRNTITKRQARIYRMAAAKRGARTWPQGEYHVRIRLSRKQELPQAGSSAEFSIRVE